MKKYPKYKDSGVEWIGKIPKHWDVYKVSRAFSIIGSGTTPASDVIKYYDNGTIPWINTGDLNDGVLKETSKKITAFALKKYSTLRIYPKDSLIIAMYGATIGKISLTEIEATTNQACCVLSYSYVIKSKFAFYWFRANKQNLIRLSYGGGQPNISQDTIKSFKIIVPPLKDQASIINFLDHKTSQIDQLIAAKEKLVEKLEAQRKAIINEAVTGQAYKTGLIPPPEGVDLKYKDSGIEWLGEIPEWWKTNKIKYSCYVKGRIGWKGLTSDEYLESGYAYLVTGTDFTNTVINWKKCHHIGKERYDEDPYIQLKNGDLLITKDGTIGKVSLVENLDKPACLNSGIFLVRSLIRKLDIKFLYWVLNSSIFKNFIDLTSSGATIKHLYQNIFVDFAYSLPKVEEQEKIGDLLLSKTQKLDNLTKKLNVSIEKLKQYKQSLISEAVTGKIDVRDWKPEND